MKLSKYVSDLVVNEQKVIYLIFFLPISLFVGSLVTNITILLIIFFFFYEIKIKNHLNFLKKKEFFILIFLSIYLLINALFIGKNTESFIRAFGFLRFVFLAFAICYFLKVKNNKYEKPVLKFWSIIFLIVTIDIIYEYIFGTNMLGFKSAYSGRLASFTGDELKIGGYYFGFVTLVLSFFYYNEKKLFYIFLIAFLVSALLIGERSNFIKILFVTFSLFFLVSKTSLFNKISLISIILIIFTLFVNFNETFKSRFFHHIFSTDDGGIISVIKNNRHAQHYTTALEIFKKNKIFGIGIKNFRHESYKKIYNPDPNQNGGSTHPHQIHLEFLSEIGILGYLLFVPFLIYSIILGVKNFIKKRDILSLSSSLFIIATLLPILPSGSFFTTYTATIFWINYAFIIRNIK